MLIGDANEFQEYIKCYYDIKSIFTSEDMTKIAQENFNVKKELVEEEKQFKSLSKPVHICITNAGAGICYGMVDAISRGEALGSDTEVALHLYDSEENVPVLEGVAMEAEDLAYPLLREIVTTSNMKQAFSGCSAVILTDDLRQGEEESKTDFYKRNMELYIGYANAILDSANPDCKVLVAGNGPVNFNVHMMCKHTNINKQNVVAVSRMVENRAKAILAERLKVNSAGVVDIVVWGNAGGMTYVDVGRARVHGYDGAIWGPPSFSVSTKEMVADDKWLQGEFLELLGKRRETVETSLRHPATFSHAASAVTLLNHWWNGSPKGQMFSLGVCSEGWYDVEEGFVFSFPVTFSDGKWSVVDNVEMSDELKEKMKDLFADLKSEYELIYPPPKPPTPEPVTTTPPPTDTDNENANNSTDTDASESKRADSDTSEDKSGAESDGEDKPTLETITEDRKAEEEGGSSPEAKSED